MNDYAMAMDFQRKYPLFFIFMFILCFDLFVLNFRNTWLNTSIFSDRIVALSKILSPPYLIEIEIIKTEISKTHLKHALPKACQHFYDFFVQFGT